MAIARLPGTGAADVATLDALRDPSATALRARAASDPHAAVKAAARQFEAMFMQQLMKSMRDSSLASGMLDNSGTQLGTEMLDTQYAEKMTGLPGGLGELIARQLERQMNGAAAGTAATALRPLPPAAAAGAPAGVDAAAASAAPPDAQAFVAQHGAAARAAESASGIPAAFMVAQAAHESGWGRHEIRRPDGSTSHNLFGIKAGAGWNGPVAQVTTTEFVDGEPRKVVAKFRAYASYEESFQDFARLIRDNPRYAPVVAAGSNVQGYAQGLQRAGYATDPGYADKLTRVINTTLRMQRAALHVARGDA